MRTLKSLRSSYYVYLFILLSAVILATGILFYIFRQDEIKKEKYIELSAISKLKLTQIVSWMDSKLSDAYILSHDIILNEDIARFFRYDFPQDTKMLTKWFNEYKLHKHYTSILVYDIKSKCRICDTTSFEFNQELYLKAISGEKPVLSDLYKKNGLLFLDIYAPLMSPFVPGKPHGVIIMRIDPERYFYPIIQSWPTPSKSSELLLFRVEAGKVVYLNKLRHVNNKPLELEFPVSEEKLPAALAARGLRGIVEGVDYRGEKVLADLTEFTGTNWLVVTKVDLAEIFAPLNELFFNIIVFCSILIASAAVVLILLWKNKKALLYKRLYDAEMEKLALIKNFEYLTKYANDVIFLFDTNGKILYANERASGVYGYSTEELFTMSLHELRAEKNNPSTEEVLSKIEHSEGLVYEAVHRRKDGSVFYVESSSRFIDIGGTKYFQSIIRDISEKKMNDEELKKALKEKEMLLKEIHHRVKNNLQLIISLLNLQAGFINEESIQKMFVDSQNRIKSMALLHEVLYRSNISSVNSEMYFNSLIPQLVTTYNMCKGKIVVDKKIEARMLSLDTMIPLGLIITEIMSNIFKYAFPDGRDGNIKIEFKTFPGDEMKLIIRDDGVGLPPDVDFSNSNTLGMQLIYSLTEQINGKVNVKNEKGTSFEITFREL